MELELLAFIKHNPDWKTILQEKPYGITIKEKNGYILFMYSQIESDFKLSLVRECRGLILREKDLKPVCMAFKKFGNYGESYVPDIDWSNVKVQEKADGSIIKLWFDNNEWHVSTNGTIDASDASLSENSMLIDGCIYKNYSELFHSVFPQNLYYDVLNIDLCYIFELVSNFNRVVIPYNETALYHIGTRNMKTLEELDIDIGIKKPKLYNLTSLEEILEIVKKLPFNDEGYVILDKFWNRLKIKSLAYISAHHLKNNGVVTKNRVLDMIRTGEQSEFLNYYPEYQEIFNEVQNKINKLLVSIEHDYILFKNRKFEDRKEMALWVNQTVCPSAIYSLYDKKVSDVNSFVFGLTNERLLKMIGEKE